VLRSAPLTTEPRPSAHRVLQQLRAGELQGATRLDLRSAGLSELPPEVIGLADTLEVLDLSDNHLSTLPPELSRLGALRVIFCSNNHFTALPSVLGRCRSLEMVGFKANQIEQLPPEALPPDLRWLILTDNRLSELPEALGRCTRLQKLMLAGNRLTALPSSIGQLHCLELLRIAANRFGRAEDALPERLLALPRLRWLAHAGNPFSLDAEHQAEYRHAVPEICWGALRIDGVLGEGASGVIHAARWQGAPVGAPQEVAVKLFKGAITSDGLPRSEVAACMAAGSHPGLVGVLGRLVDHPAAVQGLVLERIPRGYRNLAGPPSQASCTRDVYATGTRFTAKQALALVQGVSKALAHLHRQGLLHGDLYAHNLLADDAGHALLGDFGAASFVPPGLDDVAEQLKQIDQRALACLIDEIAQRCDEPALLDGLRSRGS
jgi:hypothetical protein